MLINTSTSMAQGRVTAILGPTNTGKTHFAIERMVAHRSGIIGLPLRLLAREVYDKVVRKKGAAQVALITGEEKIVPPDAHYYVCTVEAMPTGLGTAFVGVDEIQLCADSERGHVFTDRLLHARGTEETLFMGAETMRPILKRFVPNVYFVTRERFSTLSYTGPKKLTRLPRRTAVIAFSTDDVYSIAELIRSQRGGAAVVLGALSPRTRNAQVELYQSGEVDFLVATDAIGMGLNMDVDHVAFSAMEKFDGVTTRLLRPEEIGQIAGRAGRHMNDGSFGVTASAAPLDEETVSRVENHNYDPVRLLQWRNSQLSFRSVDMLIASLDAPSPARGLIRARPASDYLALTALSEIGEVRDRCTGPGRVRTLWEACQLPDFNKLSNEEHARLVRTIFGYLTSNSGVLPEDWFAKQIARLDSTEGDVPTLSGRLAHIRTWTYAANRPGWLKDAAHWQEETRAVEDRLSDALHEKLTQRFIDRRTSVLMRHLNEDEEISVTLDESGGVVLDGQVIGKLEGFCFTEAASEDGIHKRMLQTAAQKGLEQEFADRAGRLAASADVSVSLSEQGEILWEKAVIATLIPGGSPLSPAIRLHADEMLKGADREAVETRLANWLKHHIETVLEPLFLLKARMDAKPGTEEAIAPEARAVAHQLCENFGSMAIRDLPQPVDRRLLIRALKPIVWLGRRSIYIPKLLKAEAASLCGVLWSVWNKVEPMPVLPRAGLTSFVNETALPAGFLSAAGFREVAGRAIRIDMLERLDDTLEKAAVAGTTAADLRPKLVSLIGSSNEVLEAVLDAMGWQEVPAAHLVPAEAAAQAAAPQADTEAKPEETEAETPKAEEAEAPKEEAAPAAEAETEAPEADADAVSPAETEAQEATATPATETAQAAEPVMIYRRKRVRPPRHNHNGHGKGNANGNGKGRNQNAAPGKNGNHGKPRGKAPAKGRGKDKDFHVRVNPDSPFASLAGMFDKK